VARYDKYDSKLSGSRVFLAADWSSSDLEKVIGVGLNASGQLVKGAGQTGIIGILILTRVIKAGREPVDIMKRGEVVAFSLQGKPNVAFASTAGTRYQVNDTTGAVSALSGATAPAAGNTYIGHTIEADRLVVSVVEK
jgi:hypothetical protein